jgi:hypothetical protein
MCSELSADSPPYEAATAATVLLYSRSANVLSADSPAYAACRNFASFCLFLRCHCPTMCSALSPPFVEYNCGFQLISTFSFQISPLFDVFNLI